MIISFIS